MWGKCDVCKKFPYDECHVKTCICGKKICNKCIEKDKELWYAKYDQCEDCRMAHLVYDMHHAVEKWQRYRQRRETHN